MNDKNEKYDLDSILEEIRRKNEENLHPQEASQEEPAAEEAQKDPQVQPAEQPQGFAFTPPEQETEAPVPPQEPEASETQEPQDAEKEPRQEGFQLNFDVDAALRQAQSSLDDKDRTMTFSPAQFSRMTQPEGQELLEEGEEILLDEEEDGSQDQTDGEKTKKKQKKEPAEEEILEYNHPDEAPSILDDLHELKGSLTLRLVLTIIIFVALAYLAASTVMPLPIPGAISYGKSPIMFIGANLVLTAATILINNAAIGGGLLALFKMKSNNDSLVAFASLAAIAHGTAMLASPGSLNTRMVNLYFPLAVLGILFNTIGKIMFVDRIIANFKIVSANYQKYAAVKVPSQDLPLFSASLTPDEQDVAYFAKAEFLTDYLQMAYSEDHVEKVSRILTPIVVGVSLLMGAGTFLLTKDIFGALSAFAAVACICAPFTSAMIGNLPMSRATRSLYRRGTCISGYSAIEEFNNIDTVMFDSQDIFPQGTVQMHGMKAFNREKIEDAIVDAASITTAIGSPMKNIFLPVLRKQQNPQLKRVSGISGEDGLGVSAIVDTQRVLVGSRELMDRYGIILPSLEQEAKLRRDNFEILYVARAGRLSAVFVISYNADDEIAETLYDLQEQGIQIMVHSMDPFITVKRISEIFDLDENGIGLLEGPAAQEYRECAKEKARTKAYLCSTTSPVSLANAILCTERVRGAISVGNILQLISMILGFGIVAFFALTGSIVRLGCIPVMAYQLIWTLIIAIANAMRRY